jgi:GH15 family glucan-1,4-alpha-glucosidase
VSGPDASGAPPYRQPAIEDYAIVGDTRTAALCAPDGSIDWMCLPQFDDDPVFGRLIGGDGWGSLTVTVDGIQETSRRYRDGSAVLETTWRTDGAEATLTDGMVLDVSTRLRPRAMLVRHLSARGNPVTARVRFDPRTGLGTARPRAERRNGALVCTFGPNALALTARPELDLHPHRELTLTLPPGETLTVVLSMSRGEPLVFPAPDLARRDLDDSDRWWREFTGRIEYDGPERDMVARSLITLRLLTFSPAGAPVAAPTTSLPEVLGGERNWDYRYAWPRDASAGVEAFLSVGMSEEAHSFLHWLLHSTQLTRPRLRVLYTLFGETAPSERELPDAPGYRGSRPVRIGNAADRQHQLDVYGWVLDAADHLGASGSYLHRALWRGLATFADFVADRWPEPDHGIWEVRGRPDQYVHSKFMGWLALERAIGLSDRHCVRSSRRRKWASARDALAREVRDRGWNERLGSYVRTYDSDELDAALLLLPGFDLEPDEDRLRSTVEAIRRGLAAGRGLLYRYAEGGDELSGREGAFLPCSFWLAQALARTGRKEEAREAFEDACRFANDVGLLSEEIDPGTGAFRGNFPQALSHSALIRAAIALLDAERQTASTAARGSRPGSPRTRGARSS